MSLPRPAVSHSISNCSTPGISLPRPAVAHGISNCSTPVMSLPRPAVSHSISNCSTPGISLPGPAAARNYGTNQYATFIIVIHTYISSIHSFFLRLGLWNAGNFIINLSFPNSQISKSLDTFISPLYPTH